MMVIIGIAVACAALGVVIAIVVARKRCKSNSRIAAPVRPNSAATARTVFVLSQGNQQGSAGGMQATAESLGEVDPGVGWQRHAKSGSKTQRAMAVKTNSRGNWVPGRRTPSNV